MEAIVVAIADVLVVVGTVEVIGGGRRRCMLVLELHDPDVDQVPERGHVVVDDLVGLRYSNEPPSCSSSGSGTTMMISSGTRSGWAH
jgi:hypothetical protein